MNNSSPSSFLASFTSLDGSDEYLKVDEMLMGGMTSLVSWMSSAPWIPVVANLGMAENEKKESGLWKMEGGILNGIDCARLSEICRY